VKRLLVPILLVPVLLALAAVRADTDLEEIAELAATDTAPSAEKLVKRWERLDRDARRRRAKLYKVRTKARESRAEARDSRRDARARARHREAARAHDEEAAALNARLAAIEIEQAAITEGLRGMRSQEVRDWIGAEALEKVRPPALLETLAGVLVKGGGGGVAAVAAACDEVRDPRRLVPFLRALGRHGKDLAPALPALFRKLGDSAPVVRVAAARALATSGLPDAVEPLIRRLGREVEGSRTQREMARALSALTGRAIGPYADAWRGWWKANEKKIRSGAVALGGKRRGAGGEEKLDQGRFYGIPQEARRIIYVLDTSGSMEVSMTRPRWDGKAPVPARDDEDSRFDHACKELLRAVRRLRPDASFSVVFYASHAEAMHDELVPRTDEHVAALEERLLRTGPQGSTNIYEALDLALRMAHAHPDSPKGPVKADAVFLISDGSPTNGRGKAEEPARVLEAVRNWNAMQRVAIHTIGIGKEHNRTFLQQLAGENGGDYHGVRE